MDVNIVIVHQTDQKFKSKSDRKYPGDPVACDHNIVFGEHCCVSSLSLSSGQLIKTQYGVCIPGRHVMQ